MKNEVGILERCEDSGASAIVKVTNKDDAGTVPPPIGLYPITGVSTPVVQGWGSNQQELPPVALRQSTHFREPPRFPLEGDFIGPHQSLNHVVGDSTSPTPARGETRKKLREKIKMLKASRDRMTLLWMLWHGKGKEQILEVVSSDLRKLAQFKEPSELELEEEEPFVLLQEEDEGCESSDECQAIQHGVVDGSKVNSSVPGPSSSSDGYKGFGFRHETLSTEAKACSPKLFSGIRN
ncbi:hypothetical protein RHSIM_Rhsim06G0011700 [Rhododendron simsii]|uniref:Uncharacterized protein n=1 Tax=Rhododendron simsii TaxID=118357 RepID=A0A834H236_RHOSS|nr:hypothetical protein RHSIM_Rhsim06G0011700 [Rhododendron simsii]